MQKSDTIGELAKALSVAQGKIEGAKKDSTNPFFKSSYADLSSVWDACRKPLSDNGLAVVQTTTLTFDEDIIVDTTLLHSSGEWINGQLAVRPTKNDPQGMGSALTYARRYTLAAIVGVAPEDDDAEGATSRQPKQEQKTPPEVAKSTTEPTKGELRTPAQVKKIFASAKGMGYDEDNLRSLMIMKCKVESTKLLTKKQAGELIEAIECGEGLKDEKDTTEKNAGIEPEDIPY